MPLRLLAFLCFAALAALAWLLLADTTAALATLRAMRGELAERVAQDPIASAALFVSAYVIVAAIALPGAVLLTVLGGALFGLSIGVGLVMIAAPAGALLAFRLVRWLAGPALRDRLTARLGPISRGIRKDGGYYLFALRVVPVVPFFLVNILVALTPIRARTFYWASLLGMLPATLVYTNAGVQLGKLNSLAGLLSSELIASLALIGIFPLLARGPIAALAVRLRWCFQSLTSSLRWRAVRPRGIERDLMVIGAGSAGLVAAFIASSLKARVTLIERSATGGECLNTGCVPSKALLRAAHRAYALREAGGGVAAGSVSVDFPEVMREVRRTIDRVAPHDSAARYRSLGVECLFGEAALRSPWSAEFRPADGAATQLLHARRIIIATGSEPVVPPLPGLEPPFALTTDSLWSLQALPARLVVAGGGAAGCELAQAFARLGSRVTLIERSERLIPREEPAAAKALLDALAAEGIDIRLSAQLQGVTKEGAGRTVLIERAGKREEIACDRILLAMGRRARVDASELQALGIDVGADGCIVVDDWLRTTEPLIFAAGDVATGDRQTHVAGHMGAIAAGNALLGALWPMRRETHAIPRCIHTDPELARAGFTRAEALDEGLDPLETVLALAEIDRAIIEDRREGFISVLTDAQSDRILGVTIVGARAGEMIAPFTLAIRERIGLRRFLGLMTAYPGWADAARAAASLWQRDRIPAWTDVFLERWHHFRRR